jgi:hypothetical protein
VQITFDLLPGHTGSIGHRMPDGTLSTPWNTVEPTTPNTPATPNTAPDAPGTAPAEPNTGPAFEPVGHRAVCSCGWMGRSEFPPSQEGGWAATSEWTQHMKPLWAATPPDWLLNRSDNLRESLAELAASWPLQALGVLAEVERWQRPLTERAVAAARAGGTSWAEIGAALGITKQSAHQRFRAATAHQPPTSAEPPRPATSGPDRAAG